jgi:hypothetical protein
MDDDRVVKCGNCGQVLDEPTNPSADERTPCPTCDSTSRTVELKLAPGVVRATASFALLEIRKSYYERSLPFLAALVILTVASGLIGGLVVQGWASVGSSFGFSLVSFVVGLRAMGRVRSIERRS